jgi:hypothetical protein
MGAPLDCDATTSWQPIETAPRDGSDILLICNTAYTPEASIGWWSADGWRHYSRPEEKWHGGVVKWFPTHWMPLPAPPGIGEGEP